MRTWSSGFFFQAEDGIRDLVRSRGLGDVYKRQGLAVAMMLRSTGQRAVADVALVAVVLLVISHAAFKTCLLYTSDAADERSSVDLGGRRIIKKQIKYLNETTKNLSHWSNPGLTGTQQQSPRTCMHVYEALI